ncbi:MAG: triosephosphate isomerase, partial [uncultured bacterium]
MKYLVANWKSNKKETEVTDWFATIASLYRESQEKNFNNLEVVICPPFVYLPLVKNLLETYQLPFKSGAQNVSPYAEGAYTGEVTAKMLSFFAEYVIIGHSERRKYFKEDEVQLVEKVERAKGANLQPIFCIAHKQNQIPEKVSLVAYEPIEAIGTGQAETPEKAAAMANFIKQKKQVQAV